MPDVGLVLGKPQVTYRDEKYFSKGWQLCFEAKLANSFRQHVDLTTEEGDMRNLDGIVSFESTLKPAYMGFEKGLFSYWQGSNDVITPRPANYLVTLRMADEDLVRLMRTIANGIPLLSVNVSVDEMEYGWEPDGIGKKWDNVANPKIEVKGYSLFFGKHEEEEIVPDLPEPAIETAIKMLKALRGTGQTMRYVLFALVALIVLLITRH